MQILHHILHLMSEGNVGYVGQSLLQMTNIKIYLTVRPFGAVFAYNTLKAGFGSYTKIFFSFFYMGFFDLESQLFPWHSVMEFK